MRKNIDVIIPVKDRQGLLIQALNSINTQKLLPSSVIIVDDCSKKKIFIDRKYRFKTKILRNKTNKGVSFSRNKGALFSKNKYIAFLDSDDFWPPDKIINQINFMEKFNHNFTYSDYTPFTENNKNKIFKKKIIVPNSFTYEKFINNTSISSSTMIIKRSHIGIVKFPKVKTFEDYSFKCKILRKGVAATKIESGNAFYRITKNSLSSNKFKNLYWVWLINKNHNNLSFLKNIKSLFSISISSLKKYGYK